MLPCPACVLLRPVWSSNRTALQEQYTSEPEAWFIRRGGHIALEVEDFEEAEATLRRHGVEYSRHVLPGACVACGIGNWPRQWRRSVVILLYGGPCSGNSPPRMPCPQVPTCGSCSFLTQKASALVRKS